MAKILVVDDEPDMIWAITNVLLSENHSVVSVNSGEEALKKVQEVALDLVLLDFRLPGMDGIQILEKIKQLKPDLPVIMVTGYGGIEEAVQSIKIGASHYIAKPFENSHLVDMVNKTLQLDSLKKEGVFGKRLAEKIAPLTQEKTPETARTATLPKTEPESFREAPLQQKRAGSGGRIWILASIAAIAIGSFFFFGKGQHLSREYLIPHSKVSGLSWGGGYLWVCDWFNQTVYQYQVIDKDLSVVSKVNLPDIHLTGIAWSQNAIYTCDSWKKAIYKHYLDNNLTVAKKFASPGPNPSALYCDGKYLWSADGTTRKIYQHALDDNLTVLNTYSSPGLFPVGLYHDKNHFWSASAAGMKIFKNSLQERFILEKTYVFPDSFDTAQQISAFTFDDKGRIWLAYEGVNKIYRKGEGDLKEVTP